MCLNIWDFVYPSTNYKLKRTTGNRSTIQYELKMTHEKQNVMWNISNETFVENCGILSMMWEMDNCLVTSKDTVIDHHILVIFLSACNEGETWPLDCTINQPCDSPQQNISSKYQDIYNSYYYHKSASTFTFTNIFTFSLPIEVNTDIFFLTICITVAHDGKQSNGHSYSSLPWVRAHFIHHTWSAVNPLLWLKYKHHT